MPPTRIVEDYKLQNTNLTKIKYICPRCECGELVLFYERDGDCRNDYFFYDCCSPCMLLCPKYFGGPPGFRICNLCAAEFSWKEIKINNK